MPIRKKYRKFLQLQASIRPQPPLKILNNKKLYKPPAILQPAEI